MVYPISTLGDIGSIGEAVTAASAVVALVFGSRQLRLTRKLARESAVAAYVERINSPETYALISASVEYWGVQKEDRDARWAEWRALPRAEQQTFFLPMNIFETLATIYNDRSLDRRSTRRLLGDVSLDYWHEVHWFVKRYQELDREALIEWVRMNKDLLHQRQSQQTPAGSRISVPTRQEFEEFVRKAAPPAGRKRPAETDQPREQSD